MTVWRSGRSINKVEVNGEIVLDLTNDTVTPKTLKQGVTAHNSTGELITGEAADDVFIITVGLATDNGDGTFSFTPDKTYEEVNNAILAKKQCYVKYDKVYYPLASVMFRNESAVRIATFTVACQGLSMRSITMTMLRSDSTVTWRIDKPETAAKFPSNPSGGEVLYYRTGLGSGWRSTNIGTNLATDFDGIIKGKDGKLAQAEPGTDYMAPIPVTSADDGKFLRVKNGVWSAETIPDAEGGSY